MKVYEMMAAYEAADQALNFKAPPRTSYWLNRLLKSLKGEYEAAQEQRGKIAEKYGEPDKENWGKVKISGANMDAFLAEWKPIADQEIAVTAQRLKLELFDGSEIPGRLMQALDPFIEE